MEGNYPYGPLTAQRIDVIYPPNAGPNGTVVLPAVVMFHGGAWIHSYMNNDGSGKDHMSMHEVAGAGDGFATPATAWPDAEAAMFGWLTARGIGK